MNEDDITRAEVERCYGVEELSEEHARRVAGWFHGGQWSSLYAFASSGHFDRALMSGEVSDLVTRFYDQMDEADRKALNLLGTYVMNRKGSDTG